MTAALQIDITFDQILSIVKQLPKQQKIKLGKEIESELIDSKFSKLLNIFKTENIDEELIEREVESVRRELSPFEGAKIISPSEFEVQISTK